MTQSEDDEGGQGPSKFNIGKLAWGTYSDLKKLMEGDPMGAVGLLGDAGKWAQLLIPEAVATPVIAGGLMVLTATSKSMGEGSPETGGSFSEGAKLFQSNGKSLEGAYPTETWSGSASDAYTSQNSHQIQRATTMLEADNDIVRILSTQAQQVHHARTEVDWASEGLAAVIPVAMALEATVLGAPESIALQLAAVATASAFAGLAVGNLVNYANHNAAQIQEATEKYRRAGAANTPSGSSPAPSPDAGNHTGPNTPPNPNDPNSPYGPGSPGNQKGPITTGNPGSAYRGGSSSSGGSDSGGGSPAAPSRPQIPGASGMSADVGNAASTGAGMGGTPSPSQMGGMPSLPQTGSGSGSGGGGLLGSLVSAAAQAAQAATQAAQQANQQDPNAQNADSPGDDQSGDDQPGSDQSGAAAGTESQTGRAPIHVSFDAGAAHTELTVDPETVKGPIHVSLDPANPTAPPNITTDA